MAGRLARHSVEGRFRVRRIITRQPRAPHVQEMAPRGRWLSLRQLITDRNSSASSGDSRRLYFIAAALMLGGPLARLLYYERYPLLTTEAAVLVAGLVVLGISLMALA